VLIWIAEGAVPLKRGGFLRSSCKRAGKIDKHSLGSAVARGHSSTHIGW